MTDPTRDLLISLASHMAYMQGQLEAHHQLDDPEDYYWFRESVALRQKVADALAGDPAAPASPADGEVAELVKWLRDHAYVLNRSAERKARRICVLLQRQALVPVPVAERPWEREGWCDAEGRCWLGWTDEPDASWSFYKPSERDIAVVSLPAHALPIPQQQESDNG